MAKTSVGAIPRPADLSGNIPSETSIPFILWQSITRLKPREEHGKILIYCLYHPTLVLLQLHEVSTLSFSSSFGAF